jgi:hypothetical protein
MRFAAQRCRWPFFNSLLGSRLCRAYTRDSNRSSAGFLDHCIYRVICDTDRHPDFGGYGYSTDPDPHFS